MGIFSRRSRPDPSGDGERGDPHAEAQRAFEQGMRMWKQGRGRKAASAFAAVTRIEPNSVDAQFLLGASLAEAGDPEAAIAPLRKCLELEPDHPDGHNTLAMILGRLGQYTEADAHLAKAAFLGHPQSPETLRGMKMSYCRRCGNPVDRVDPGNATVRYYGPRVGMECGTCPTVFCVQCVLGDSESALISPPCPACGSALTGLREDSEL